MNENRQIKKMHIYLKQFFLIKLFGTFSFFNKFATFFFQSIFSPTTMISVGQTFFRIFYLCVGIQAAHAISYLPCAYILKYLMPD